MMPIIKDMNCFLFCLSYAVSMSVVVLISYPFIVDMNKERADEAYTGYVLAIIFAWLLVPFLITTTLFHAIFSVFPNIARNYRASKKMADDAANNEHAYTISPSFPAAKTAALIVAACAFVAWMVLRLTR